MEWKYQQLDCSLKSKVWEAAGTAGFRETLLILPLPTGTFQGCSALAGNEKNPLVFSLPWPISSAAGTSVPELCRQSTKPSWFSFFPVLWRVLMSSMYYHNIFVLTGMSEQGLALEEKFDFFSGGLIRLKRICGKERFWVTCLMDMELRLQLYWVWLCDLWTFWTFFVVFYLYLVGGVAKF